MQIDDNIPIPPIRKRVNIYRFGDMEVGQSIFITDATQQQIAGFISSFRRGHKGRNYHKKFTTRKVTEPDAEGKPIHGTRVWRFE